ncbi:hypothetical protein HanIR_Chr08g0363631 [Helianthus annuus]|nr:hypothetical protein HanIR_Chr08g0363631 [Helianthus annuus]KAJ0719010.1 hypothetical protein HanLR1_Chr08g0276991 [Helianthus annuus]
MDREGKVGATKQVETRKKKREDKTEEKKAEEPVAETPRKRPSNSSFFDYVVVSDTLSCVDARVKRPSRDPDDDSTLTEMMKKRKMLEDKKKELDAQAAAALAEKKSKLQKETTAAPSESEIDLGMFSEKTDNLLEKIFKSASTSRAPKSGRSRSKIDISKITPPASPPSKPLDLSLLSRTRRGRGKRMMLRLSRRKKWLKMLLLVLGEMRFMLRVWKLNVDQVRLLLRAPFVPSVCGVLGEVVHPALIKAQNFIVFRVVHGLPITLLVMIFPMLLIRR